MASTYSALYVHVVFATRGRAPMIADAWRQDLHNYIGGTVRGLGPKPMIVGGVADHVHILLSIRPSHVIADLVREIKRASSLWGAERYNAFGWQGGYAALSVSPSAVESVTAYIARQEEHHRKVTSADELRQLLVEHGIEFDEHYFV